METHRLMSIFALSILITGGVITHVAHGEEGLLNNSAYTTAHIKIGHASVNPTDIGSAQNIVSNKLPTKTDIDSANPSPVNTSEYANIKKSANINTSTNRTGIKSILSNKGILVKEVVTSLAHALDNFGLTYTSGGYQVWYGSDIAYKFGGDAAISGTIGNNQESWMQTTVTGPGTVRFWWSVSSETNYDFLEFYIDGILQHRISGYSNTGAWLQIPWQLQTYQISSYGTHTLEWRYVKDASYSGGSDTGFVDRLEYFTPIITVEDAVDNHIVPLFYGTIGGGLSWIGQNSVYYLGGDAEASGMLPDNGWNYIATTVTGPGTTRFLWSVSSEPTYDFLGFYIDGVLQNSISGYVPWQQQSYNVGAGTHVLMWQYSKDASIGIGDDTGYVDKFEYYAPPISLGDAVNNAFTFTTGSLNGGNYANWIGQYVQPYDGASARSGTIMDNENTWMKTSLAGPGTIQFWWSVSSEANYDNLEFYIDGVLQNSISGEVNWQQQSYNVGVGTHYLMWRYVKDSSSSAGSDAGWVDKLVLVTQSSSITVTSPNGGENWPIGTTNTISWTSSGNPGANVKIELLKGTAVNSVISSNTPNDGSQTWTIPSTQTLGNDYKIRIASTSSSTYTDTSNGNFIISSLNTPVNLLKNPGFETASGTVPQYWTKSQTGTKAIFTYPATGRVGGKAVSIRYAIKESGKVALWQQTGIAVVPSKQYKLSGYMKLEGVTGGGALPRYNGAGVRVNWYTSANVLIRTDLITKSGTIGWIKYEKTFTAPSNAAKATVGGDLYNSAGKVTFDDLSFVRIS